MRFCEVLVFRGVPNLYTYGVPDVISVVPGDHVDIPFGRSHCVGLVMGISDGESDRPCKPILSLHEKKSAVHPELLSVISWLYKFYRCTPHQAYQTVVGNKKKRLVPEEEPPVLSTDPDPVLTEEQQAAVDAIISGQGFSEWLLYGITSSGKTEVYIQVAKAMLARQKTVLMLLPEIALTPQFMHVFTERFGSTCVILHSGLTPKYREIAWARIESGQVQIVIGPRSVVFAPVQNLGLIVIDEEHESTYKQENHPRYDTAEVAKFRCEESGASLVYGSATPAIERYYSATQNRIGLLCLSDRIFNRPLPKIEIVDMTTQMAQNPTPISSVLHDAISETLALGEKILILVNRRGYAPYISCQKCGKLYACPQCQLSFTYHHDMSFRCHRCDIKVPVTHMCPSCQKPHLSFGGTGIQKIEMELVKRFPDAKIDRLDRDTAKTSKALEKILKDFKSDGQILIGTQMIAKGHHIESVTLVGVIGIDTTLNMPDFRSPERTFQLLTQVAGRAGRGDKLGRVFIQTFQPDHYAIQHAKTHNYKGFYEEELPNREAFLYPPYSRLTHIILSSLSEKDVKTHAAYLAKWLKSIGVVALGPTPAPIEKIKNHYRWHFLIKSLPEHHEDVKEKLAQLPLAPKSVRVIVDYDPKSIF